MAENEREPEAPAEPGLSSRRCPNCDEPLKFVPDLSEAFCPTCGIFVEILQPSPSEKAPPPTGETDNQKRLTVARFYLDMEDVLEDEEPETPPAQEPVPEAGPEPAVEPGEAPAAEPVAAPEPVAPTPVEPGESSPEEAAPPPPEPPTPAEPIEAEPESEGEGAKGEAAHETTEAPVEAAAAPLEPVEQPPVVRPRPRPRAVAVPRGSSAATVLLERPTVVVPVPPPPEEVAPEPELWREAWEARHTQAKAQPTPAEARPAKVQARLGHRVVFYAGAIQVAIGGAGLILGSILHDMFRVPLFGHAYDAFGSINTLATLVGAILTIAGLATMAFGSHAGASRKGRATGG